MNIIREAMGTMAKRGLAKYTQEAADGRVCAAGAFSITKTGKPYMIFDGNEDLKRAWKILDQISEEQYPERVRDRDALPYLQTPAANLNNHPDTTLEEMLRVMDKAAVRLDELVA